MKVLLVTPWDTHDPAAWSGVVAKMREALESRCEVEILETSGLGVAWIDRNAARAVGRLTAKHYLGGQALATARLRGRRVTEAVRRSGPDVVLAIAASQDVAFLRTDVPIVQVTDATFAAIRDYYPLFRDAHWSSVPQGALLARRAKSSRAFCVASAWAGRSLVEDYRIPRTAVHTVPFGPGIEPAASGELGQRTAGAPLRVLMVASDWARKGGSQAVDAVALLRERGTEATLTVVGTASGLPGWVDAPGRVDRADMPSVYRSHDVLLELAAANAGGVTMTDAHAFGLPVVATDTGGTSSIVVDGTTGILVPSGLGAADAAALALEALAATEYRSAFSAAALQRHRELLSWDVWADSVLDVCRGVAGEHER